MAKRQENRLLLAFLKDIRRFTHLPETEQRRLGALCAQGVRAKKQLREALKSDAAALANRAELELHVAEGIAATKTLIETNARLALTCAKSKTRPGIDLLDAVQAAMIGYLVATANYDPCQPSKFTSYATWWQQTEYLNLYRHSSILSLPRSFAHMVPDVYAAHLAFETEHGREPNDKELAATVNKRKRKRVWENLGRDIAADMKPVVAGRLREVARMTFHSIDSAFPGSQSNNRSTLDIADNGPSPETVAIRKRVIMTLPRAIRAFERIIRTDPQIRMKTRYLDVFRRRVIVHPEDRITLEALAIDHGLTRERIRQIAEALRVKFIAFLRRKYPALAEYAHTA